MASFSSCPIHTHQQCTHHDTVSQMNQQSHASSAKCQGRISRCHRWIGPIAILLIAQSCLQAATIELGGRVFHLPDGFQLESIAAPPLVMRPICADFDDRGDMYVADSSGSNENVQEQLKKRPHRILRLRDSDGDGVYDQSIVFADRMMFPEGLLCYDGSVFVAAPPSIWKLTDTDGDGVADRREEWFDAKTLTGCANDLHGPYLGRDGWIYWCKGAFAHQTYQRAVGPDWETRAAHIFRRRPEGGMVEPVMTGGMDNPVEVVFTSGGERIFTTTFLQHPAGGLRDGLIHAIYGGVYGKIHSVIDEHQRTGEVMPVLTHLGAAAPCGLCLTESDGLGESYRGNLFACLFNMHKVTRHQLRPHGATFQSTTEDFLVCDDLDFHPTDVLEDADGSLVVIDTGGWYKLCCPTSALQKPDVLGAIYRVRPTTFKTHEDPRGEKTDWGQISPDEAVKYLADRRPRVRDRASRRLISLGEGALPELQNLLQGTTPAETRLAAVWTAVRMDSDKARALVRRALTDPAALVRQAAAHGVSVHRDTTARADLESMLASREVGPANRRVAAEALGRLGDRQSVEVLCEAAANADGRELEHSITFALIEIGAAADMRPYLQDPREKVRRSVALALDQMSPPSLTTEEFASLLTDSNPELRKTAIWIASRHPEWSDQVARVLRPHLVAGDSDLDQLGQLLELVPHFAEQTKFQATMADLLVDAEVSMQRRKALLQAMGRSRVRELPDPWAHAFASVLATDGTSLIEDVIGVMVQLPKPDRPNERLSQSLRGILTRSDMPSGQRLKAGAAIPGGLNQVSDDLFRFLRANLAIENAVADLRLAIETLVSAKLEESQLRALFVDVEEAGPMELGPLLRVYEQTKNPEIGHGLVDSLLKSSSAVSLPGAIITQQTAHFGPEVVRRTDELLRRLEMDPTEQRIRLKTLLSQLGDGDVRRGHRVFHGSKAACSACHAMGYLGGTIGPDLTRIGGIRKRSELLEAIVFPSSSFVRSYEPLTVISDDGLVWNGTVKDQTPTELILINSERREIRIERESIEETRPGKVSIMPSGLDGQLSQQELADLLAFLQDAK